MVGVVRVWHGVCGKGVKGVACMVGVMKGASWWVWCRV